MPLDETEGRLELVMKGEVFFVAIHDGQRMVVMVVKLGSEPEF